MTDTRTFYDASFAGLLATSPEVAAELGIRAVGGHGLPQDRFSDVTEAGVAARNARVAEVLARLRDLPPPADAAEAESRAIYEHFLTRGRLGRLRGVEGHPYVQCEAALEHLTGTQSEMITCLTDWHPLATAEDAENFVARVAAMPRQIDDQIATLKARAARGNVVPSPIVRRVLGEVAALLGLPADAHPVAQRYRAARGGPAPERVRALVEDAVTPAYRRLHAFLQDDYPKEDRIGLWRMPGGEECYRFLLRAHTTAEPGPDETFTLGNEELLRLQRDTAGKLRALGYDGEDLGRGFRAFDADPRFRAGGDGQAREQLLADLRAIVADTEARIRPQFGVWPRAGVEVRAIPPALEGNRHSTYVPPAADGSRPGVFDVNLAQVLSVNRLDRYTVAYHEAMPGHHVQLAIAQELDAALPAFRRILVHDGYIEGWAKYAETLPRLAGINTDPHWDLARSRNELYSTANLVLDSGIHHKRWDRPRAVSFVCANTGAPRALAENIVDRCIAWPGQLAAYKTGMLTVVRARERMQNALGARFDARRFHDAVLRGGSMPLALLDRVVDAEIRACAAP